MLKILGKKFPNDNFPPIIIHIFYILMSVTFCVLYNHLVINKIDIRYDEYGGIYRALEGNSVKAVQVRMLIPLIFKAISFLHIPDRAILLIIFITFTYLTIIFFYLTLNIYFRNSVFNYFIALALFYPMIWNFMLLNGIYFFVDHALLFFLTAGLYFILTRKNLWLLVTFLVGALNHTSITMLIPVFMLFNYNRLLKKDTIIYLVLLIAGYIGFFFVMNMIYPNFTADRNADLGLIHFSDTVAAMKEMRPSFIIRYITLNFGGIHVFAALFLVSGVWKKIKQQYVFIFLLIVPYFILAVLRFGIRLEEMRNWIPLIPFVMLLALLYFSQIKNPLLRLSDEVSRETIS